MLDRGISRQVHKALMRKKPVAEPPPTSLLREVAARHSVDPRTLLRAWNEGCEAIKKVAARERVTAALKELQAAT